MYVMPTVPRPFNGESEPRLTIRGAVSQLSCPVGALSLCGFPQRRCSSRGVRGIEAWAEERLLKISSW